MKRGSLHACGWMAALTLVLAAAEVARAAPDEDPLEGFEVVQFIASAGLTPTDAMVLDNNSAVLLACREGRTVEELSRDGVEVVASQLELLRMMRLLRRGDAGRWHTRFPMLAEAETRRLREVTAALAEQAIVAVRPEIDGLSAALEASGMQDRAYSVFFSYVMDGMVWGFLEEYRRVPLRRLSAARPFWAGEIWALAGSQEERLTTGSIVDRGMTIKVTSTSRRSGPVRSLLARHSAVKTALRDYVGHGRVVDESALAVLEPLGIVDGEGAFLVPVIDEIGRDAVFLAAEKLTSRLVDWVLAEIDFAAQRRAFGFESDPQALLVIYHELMREVMASLEAEGAVTRPPALRAGSPAAGTDIGDLVVVVDRAPRSQPDQDVVPSTGEPETRRDVVPEKGR